MTKKPQNVQDPDLEWPGEVPEFATREIRDPGTYKIRNPHLLKLVAWIQNDDPEGDAVYVLHFAEELLDGNLEDGITERSSVQEIQEKLGSQLEDLANLHFGQYGDDEGGGEDREEEMLLEMRCYLFQAIQESLGEEIR